MTNIIEIKNLSFGYNKDNNIFNNLSLNIKKGKITTILGKNGCGKSTLIKLLAKNLDYNSGSIKLENKELSSYKLRELASKLSIVYQKNETPKEITVNDMVSFARLPYQNIFFYKKSKEDKEKVDFALKHTSLTEYKDKYVSELSGGQLQRVYIAMCLAQSTDIIILDEPTTFLDIKYQKSIMKLIKHLNNTLGITIIMVLHDINQALTYSDYIIGLLNGEVVKNDSADKFYNKKIESQRLLLPQKMEVTESEKEMIFENIEIFNDFGFEIDEFSDQEIIFRAIPTFDFRDSIQNVFLKLLEDIKNEAEIKDLRENIIISMSCKGAVKAGQKLDLYEMQNMVRRLHEVGKYTCPHGRPIIVKLTRNDLDKMFGRKK